AGRLPADVNDHESPAYIFERLPVSRPRLKFGGAVAGRFEVVTGEDVRLAEPLGHDVVSRVAARVETRKVRNGGRRGGQRRGRRLGRPPRLPRGACFRGRTRSLRALGSLFGMGGFL